MSLSSILAGRGGTLRSFHVELSFNHRETRSWGWVAWADLFLRFLVLRRREIEIGTFTYLGYPAKSAKHTLEEGDGKVGPSHARIEPARPQGLG